MHSYISHDISDALSSYFNSIDSELEEMIIEEDIEDRRESKRKIVDYIYEIENYLEV